LQSEHLEATAAVNSRVKVSTAAVSIPSYLPASPDRNPLFLEARVYQGSSGRVYPLPVIDRIASEATDHRWNAVYIENEYLAVTVLPEIGGRIHRALDKRNGYDFFYRQDVIKPALVGLAGPWMSGGVEFNFPQHHRPATFMPVAIDIEHEQDGAVTVWCGDHDPIARLKGMHGIRLRPGVAVLEVRVRLYNRTEDTQTFLWWANAATEVHEAYQSFFPADVRFAADHAKRALTTYPQCRGTYYGVDYERRSREGVPESDWPEKFRPSGESPANDLGWYANIPVPTSYMIAGSRGDFFGGYDHMRNAGTVAFANHHIAPGKKQWTWGNHAFGYAWDRHLTDDARPYVELMSGAYTDNQPDFSFLAPGETKSFSQFWYSISDLGVPSEANLHAAMRVQRSGDTLIVHVQAMHDITNCILVAKTDGVEHGRWHSDLSPHAVLHHTFANWPQLGAIEVVLHAADDVLLRHAPFEMQESPAPELATEPSSPELTKTSDELFLTGLHLEQYRHPTRLPEAYWQEAIRRDAGDSRSNHAMGRWHLRRGEFAAAEQHLRVAINRLTTRNPNPYDGEPHYNLGRALRYQGRDAEAYDAFYKCTWNAAWRGPGYQRLAEIDCTRRQWATALDHLDRSLRSDTDNLTARNLKVLILRKLGRSHDATTLLRETRALDPLDSFACWLDTAEVPPRDDDGLPPDGQQRLDLAFDLRRAGLLDEALLVLSPAIEQRGPDGAETLRLYLLASTLKYLGHAEQSASVYRQAAASDPAYVFPSRLEELLLLEEAMRENADDARAPYYLGNLLYDRRRHHEAIALWEKAVALDMQFPTAWRNLAFGYFNVLGDAARARTAFAQARAVSPEDARLLFEQDQLLKRTREPLASRLQQLEAELRLVTERDDLSVELAVLLNSTGRPHAAQEVLLGRSFQPWEGGEGLVLDEFTRSCVLLAQRELAVGNAAIALVLLQQALDPPKSLGEKRHLLANFSLLLYWLGRASLQAGSTAQAHIYWEQAAQHIGDFQQMAVQPVSAMTYWSARSLQALGRHQAAATLLQTIERFAAKLLASPAVIDYFATSLPTMLLFYDDLQERQTIAARFLQAQASLGLGHAAEAMQTLREILALEPAHAPSADLLLLGVDSMRGALPAEIGTPHAVAERTLFVWGIAAAAALGGLLFGYDWVVIGGARQFYEIYFHLGSEALIGWANSCALVGCLAGSLIAGLLAERFGRRPVLLLSAVLFAVSSVLTGWAFHFESFVTWRIVGGVAIGLSSNVSPLYISEISPAAVRGRLVSLNQFAIVVGILLAQIANWRIARPVDALGVLFASWNVQYGWRWMFTAVAAPAIIFTITSIFLPESPRWLLARRRDRQASDVLERVGGKAYAAEEVASIRLALAEEATTRSSRLELLQQPVRRILLVGVTLAVLQQWTGINVLFNYAADVYRSAGYGANQILLNIVITGAINLIFTVLSMLLVDRIGRRPLMILGCLGIGLCHLLCALAFRREMHGSTVLVLTLSAIACYALTLAPITWVLIAEIFPNSVRSEGVSISVSALWTAAFLLTYTFPIVNRLLGSAGVFFAYGVICLLGCAFVTSFVPETRGRTLEQIQSEWSTR